MSVPLLRVGRDSLGDLGLGRFFENLEFEKSIFSHFISDERGRRRVPGQAEGLGDARGQVPRAAPEDRDQQSARGL